MNYLVVHYPEGTERAFSLESGELSVGRDSGCDVVLASQAVSRRHARIYTWKDQVFVEDLGSESGILVSGRRVGKAAMIPPGVPIVIDTFRLVVEDREDASQAPGGWGVLKGRTAPVKRQTFILEIPEYYVGRAEENDLVLAHQSISRRHAVLRYNNGVPQVTDLDSSTGVFIGGKRVKEAALTEGAVLKFGDIEFSYGAPAKRASRPAAAGSGRRPVFIMLAVFVALAMVVAAIALKRHAAQQRLIEQRSQEAAKLKSDSDFVLDRIDRAAAHIQKDQFEEALADDGDALDRDPLNTEALNLRKKALSEIASRKVFEEAETSYALGRFDEALKGYNMVPSDSAYNVRADTRVRELRGRVVREKVREARQLQKKGDPAKVHDLLVEALDMDPKDVEAMQLIRGVEAALTKKKKKFTAWVPPQAGSAAGAAGAGAAIEGRYQDPRLSRCVMLYFTGKSDEALRELGKLLKDKKAADIRPQIDQVQREVFVARSRFLEGQAQILQGNVRDAARFWKIALEADGRVVSAVPPSYYRDEISRLLAEAYVKLGTSYLDKGRNDEAFEQFRLAREISPDNLDAMHAMKKLERIAERMFEESVTSGLSAPDMKDRMNQIMAITTPGTSVYRMASEKIQSLR